jgi:hypothetical protein
MNELACPSSVFVERLTHQWTTNTFLHDAQTANVFKLINIPRLNTRDYLTAKWNILMTNMNFTEIFMDMIQ